MCSTARFQYPIVAAQDSLARSANWTYDDDTRMFAGPRFGTLGRAIPRFAGIALLLAISSASSCTDPWSETQRQRSELTMSSTFQTNSRRRVSPREARKLALAVLHRAESERAAAAQSESKQGIDWEDVS